MPQVPMKTQRNKEWQKAYNSAYYKKHRDKIRAQVNEYRIKNLELIRERKRKEYCENKATIRTKQKDYYLNNKEKITKSSNAYYLKNKKSKLAYQAKYGIRKYHTDVQYRLASSLRKRLRHAIKGESKGGSAVRDLGCTIPELKFYIEGKFKDGMTWENWSFTGWHLDHVIPLVFFDLTDREQLLKAVHYTNLQPLWAHENLVKNAKLLNL